MAEATWRCGRGEADGACHPELSRGCAVCQQAARSLVCGAEGRRHDVGKQRAATAVVVTPATSDRPVVFARAGRLSQRRAWWRRGRRGATVATIIRTGLGVATVCGIAPAVTEPGRIAAALRRQCVAVAAIVQALGHVAVTKGKEATVALAVTQPRVGTRACSGRRRGRRGRRGRPGRRQGRQGRRGRRRDAVAAIVVAQLGVAIVPRVVIAHTVTQPMVRARAGGDLPRWRRRGT